jgi:hypothetical protein
MPRTEFGRWLWNLYSDCNFTVMELLAILLTQIGLVAILWL